MSESGSRQEESTTPIQPWEWIAATLGLLLLLFALGVLIRAQGSTEDNFLAPTVTYIRSHPESAGGHAIEIEVINQANETLSEVEILGTLSIAGDEPEAVTATITYLPAQSTRHLFLVFQHPPTESNLELKVQSYQVP